MNGKEGTQGSDQGESTRNKGSVSDDIGKETKGV